MDRAADLQHLFQLEQVLSVGDSSAAAASKPFSGGTTSCIKSFAASSCGTAVVLVLSHAPPDGTTADADLHERSGAKEELQQPPVVVGVSLLPAPRRQDLDPSVELRNFPEARGCFRDEGPPFSSCASTTTTTAVSVSWPNWFIDNDLTPSCVALCPEDDLCLVACRKGALFIIPTRILCKGFEPSCSSTLHPPNASTTTTTTTTTSTEGNWSGRTRCNNNGFSHVPNGAKIYPVNYKRLQRPLHKSFQSSDLNMDAVDEARRSASVFNNDTEDLAAGGFLPQAMLLFSNPTSLVWWTTTTMTAAPDGSRSLGIVGTQGGWVVLVDLVSGEELGNARPSEKAITRMELLKDDTKDCTYLFITDDEWKQWRILLERRSTGFTWYNVSERASPPIMFPAKQPTAMSGNFNRHSSEGTSDSESMSAKSAASASGFVKIQPTKSENDSKTSWEDLNYPTRGRLAGLRHLSVAGLNSIRQKLSEGKKMLDRKVSGVVGNDNDKTLNSWCDPNNQNLPEPLRTKVGDTRLLVQPSGNGAQPNVLGGLFPDTAILTIHNSELEVMPQVAYRLPRQCEQVLILDKVMLVVSKGDQEKDHLKVVSSYHALIHADGSRNKEDPLIQHFALSENERVIGLRKALLGDRKSIRCCPTVINDRHDKSDSSASLVVRPIANPVREEDIEGTKVCNGRVMDKDGHSWSTSFSCNILRSNTQSEKSQPFLNHTSSGDKIFDPKELFASEVKHRAELLQSHSTPFPECIVVSNKGVYVLKLNFNPVTAFLQSATQGDIKGAERVAATFELDASALLELAADLRLSDGDFAGAISLYRLSGCKHLKAVLKFAASGNVAELLSYLSVLSKTPNLDVTSSDRIHLSNLTLMAYFQQLLSGCSSESVGKRDELRGKICHFLDENSYIDESLAIRMAAETREWGLLDHFCYARGLNRLVVASICEIFTLAHEAATQKAKSGYYNFCSSLQDVTSKIVSDMPHSERRGLLCCLLRPGNLPSCMMDPELGKVFILVLQGLLPFFSEDQLELLCDNVRPTSSKYRVFRPIVDFKFVADSNSNPSLSFQRQGYEFFTTLIDFYICVLLQLVKKYLSYMKTEDGGSSELVLPSCDSELVRLKDDVTEWKKLTRNRSKETSRMYEWDGEVAVLSLRDGTSTPIIKGCCVSLTAGPSHAMLLRPRSNVLLSWGSNHFNVLGHSQSDKSQRCFSPKSVDFFSSVNKFFSLKQAEDEEDCDSSKTRSSNGRGQSSFSEDPAVGVLSASCGKSHSLVLTTCGLYSWGMSKHGQLGLGKGRKMAKQPELIPKLANKTLLAVACGHYHSVALDAAGNVWTWGWGVYGQLGHGAIEDEFMPKRVKDERVSGNVCRVAAGHVHTMLLTSDGSVWVFGSNVFGQLGCGELKKSIVPLKVTIANSSAMERPLTSANTNEKIGMIACGYFHNLALSEDGHRLYIWGCDPYMLRMEAQKRRKESLLRPRSPKGLSGKKSSSTCGNNDNAKEGDSALKSSMPASAPEPTKAGIERDVSAENATKSDEDLKKEHLFPALVDTTMIEGFITSISCGHKHSAVLSSLGIVYTFGRNLDGQLGVGNRRPFKSPTQVTALADENIVEVACGGDCTLALSESGTVFGWGNNTSGQLGKPPIEDQGKSVPVTNRATELANNSNLMLLKTTRRVILQQSLQNSCDVPRPVVGVTSGVYSEECFDPTAVHARVVGLVRRLQRNIPYFEKVSLIKMRGPCPELSVKLCKARNNLHMAMEAFCDHIELKPALKKCLVSENPQAAAKLSLLSSNVLQSFEFSLQAIIKQLPLKTASDVGGEIFHAYFYYLHFDQAGVDKCQVGPCAKQQLTERLIACWQDQNFSFEQLESYFLEFSDPTLLQVLVLTLFCPDEERDTSEAPLISGGSLGTGIKDQKLADLFTTEFCLKIGDNFVGSLQNGETPVDCRTGEDEVTCSASPSSADRLDQHERKKLAVSRWLLKTRRQSSNAETEDEVVVLQPPQNTDKGFSSLYNVEDVMQDFIQGSFLQMQSSRLSSSSSTAVCSQDDAGDDLCRQSDLAAASTTKSTP